MRGGRRSTSSSSASDETVRQSPERSSSIFAHIFGTSASTTTMRIFHRSLPRLSQRLLLDSNGHVLYFPEKHTVDASAALDSHVYCKRQSVTAATTTSGTGAALRLQKGRQDLQTFLLESTTQYPIAVQGHGVPPQLLDHVLDYADDHLLGTQLDVWMQTRDFDRASDDLAWQLYWAMTHRILRVLGGLMHRSSSSVTLIEVRRANLYEPSTLTLEAVQPEIRLCLQGENTLMRSILDPAR